MSDSFQPKYALYSCKIINAFKSSEMEITWTSYHAPSCSSRSYVEWICQNPAAHSYLPLQSLTYWQFKNKEKNPPYLEELFLKLL